MQQLDQKMKEVRRKHTIETIVKLQEYKRRHIDLTQRVIQVRRRKKKCDHSWAFASQHVTDLHGGLCHFSF